MTLTLANVDTMRILFLTHYFEPDITSNAVIATDLAKQLVELGNQVTVVTSVPHYDEQRIPPAYQNVIIKRSIESGGSLRIWRTWLFVPRNKRSTFQRFLSYLSYNLMSCLLLPFIGRYQVILTMSPPLTNGLVAFAAGVLRRAPFVYNVQDLFPDLPVELGLIKNHRLIALLYWVESFVYRHASRLTVLSVEMKEKILQKLSLPTKSTLFPTLSTQIL